MSLDTIMAVRKVRQLAAALGKEQLRRARAELDRDEQTKGAKACSRSMSEAHEREDALKARIAELEGERDGLKERIDEAWHAVCNSGMPGPEALERLLEILDGQHDGSDPHMAAIDVLRKAKDGGNS